MTRSKQELARQLADANAEIERLQGLVNTYQGIERERVKAALDQHKPPADPA